MPCKQDFNTYWSRHSVNSDGSRVLRGFHITASGFLYVWESFENKQFPAREKQIGLSLKTLPEQSNRLSSCADWRCCCSQQIETLSLHSSCVRVRHMLSDFLVQLPHENGRTNTRPGICTEPLCIRGVCMLGSERQANHDGLSQGAQVSVLC